MSKTLPSKAVIPSLTDQANIEKAFTDYDKSIIHPVPVSTETEANQVRAGTTAGTPVLVFRTDLGTLMAHPNTGTPGEYWTHIGGPQHGIQANIQIAAVPSSAETDMPIKTIVRQSEGWQIHSDGVNLRVPAGGVYDAKATVLLDGTASTLGRVFMQIVVNNTRKERVQSATNEDRLVGSATLILSKGDLVKVVAFHKEGGARYSQGEVILTQIANPRWT